jgi:hypothetical protein
MTTPAAPALAQRYQAAVNSVLAELRAAGRADLAIEVQAEAERPRPATPVVLVAGETKRGKSSLVNVLVRHPGLSAAGLDIATTSYVILSHGETEQAKVIASQGGKLRQRPISLGEVGDWSSSAGNPANSRQVVGVEVKLPAAVLRSVTLIDTPGAGGLDSVYGAVSVPTARQADAVIFVLDAGAPLSAPELAYLTEVSARVDALIIAVNKIDTYPGWDTTLADNRALLTRYAPALASVPVVGVSARIAELALAQGDSPLAAELWQESGLDELSDLLTRRVAGRSVALRACNVLLTARDGLRELASTAVADVVAAQGAPALREQLDAERARLAEFRKESSSWQHKLVAGIQTLRIDHGADLGRALGALQRRYSDAIERVKTDERLRLTDQLVTDIDQLAASLNDQAALKLTELITQLIGDIDSQRRLAGIARQISAPGLDGIMRVERSSSSDLTKVDKLAGAVSFSSGKSIGGIVTALPFLAGFGLPVIGLGLGAGAAFSFLMTKSRQDLNTQAKLRGWCQSQINEAQRQVASDFARRMVTVQENLREELTEHIDQQRRQLDQSVARYDRALAAGKAESQGMVAAAEATVTRLVQSAGQIDRLLADLATFRSPVRLVVSGQRPGLPQPAPTRAVTS